MKYFINDIKVSKEDFEKQLKQDLYNDKNMIEWAREHNYTLKEVVEFTYYENLLPSFNEIYENKVNNNIYKSEREG